MKSHLSSIICENCSSAISLVSLQCFFKTYLVCFQFCNLLETAGKCVIGHQYMTIWYQLEAMEELIPLV